MTSSFITANEYDSLFTPKSGASTILIPLLDALDWKGDENKILEHISHVLTHLCK